MTDYYPNLTEKISEAITNVFKKTKIFEKIGKIEIYIGSFIVISSIITLTNTYMNYCNMRRIKWLEEKIEGCENILKHNIQISRQENALCHDKIEKQIKGQASNSLDIQEKFQKIIEKIVDVKLLLETSKKEETTFSQVKSIDSIDECWRENIIKQEDIKDMEDNELLNECYDSIPLNNLKKNTSSWLI
jgi:hypothetical protein